MKLGFSQIDAKDYDVLYIEERMDDGPENVRQVVALFVARGVYLEMLAKARQEAQDAFDRAMAAPMTRGDNYDAPEALEARQELLERTTPDRPEWDEFYYT